MRLMILGSDGMVGHVVALYFKERGHELLEIREGDNRLSDFGSLCEEVRGGGYDAIINCLAVVNAEAEEDKVEAVRINSLLPHFLESVTAGMNTVVVHRSTDCIFSGDKGSYSIDDLPDGRSFYARSKALGELDNGKNITIRTSLIGPETEIEGKGLFNWFYNQKEVNGFANSIWTGITTIEFAREIEWVLQNKKHGIIQLVPDRAISKYDLLVLFEKHYPGNRKINRIENERVDKSLIQYCGGVHVPDYDVMISDMRSWTDSHNDLYRYE